MIQCALRQLTYPFAHTRLLSHTSISASAPLLLRFFSSFDRLRSGQTQLFQLTTSFLDSGFGGFTCLMYRNLEVFVETTATEQFDRLTTEAQQTARSKGLRINRCSSLELVQLVQIHFVPLLAIRLLEAALGKAHLQLHLAAFKARAYAAALTSFLAFVTFTRRLAQATTNTASQTLLGLVGAFGRTQVAKVLHFCVLRILCHYLTRPVG